MQIKTIQKIIAAKLEAWLATITDEHLRAALKKHIIVSGGCVVTMFEGKPVNDYDVYIADMDTLLNVVDYYTTGHSIVVFDGRRKETLVQDIADKYRKDAENVDEIEASKAVAIRTLHEDQVKLFFMGAAFRKVDVTPEENSYKPVFFSANAITLSDSIQIVCRFSGPPEKIHENFDFIHATNYFTFDKGLVTNIKALESYISKQLFYQGSKYPITSILRMKKFLLRDWKINAGEVLKIMFQISELDLKDPDVLEEQLIGVDVAYFDTLISILRGKDRQTLTSQYLNTVIDRVFNSAEDVEE